MLVLLAYPLGHYEQQGIHYSTTMEGEKNRIEIEVSTQAEQTLVR